MQTWKTLIPAVAIAALLFCVPLTACGGAGTMSNTETNATIDADSGQQYENSYTFFVGTTSQKTHEKVMSMAKAKKLLEQIALEYCDGYTIYRANGGWKDTETGDVYEEGTLVVFLVGVSNEEAEGFANAAKEALDQTSVLMVSDSLAVKYVGQ